MSRQFFLALSCSTLFLFCNCDSRTRQSRSSNTPPTNEVEMEFDDFDTDFEALNDTEIGEMIDYYAGHPSDPQLPNDVMGATDEVIEATAPRELADLIIEGKDFALKEVKRNPRYLFSLGRLAYFLNYEKKAKQWLTLAAENDSPAANAYLGYLIYYNENDPKKASTYLAKALNNKFEDSELKDILELCNFDPRKENFNNKDIINALYNRDWSFIDKDEKNKFYLAKIHETLWSNDILWLADDSKILLELDPSLAKTKESWVDRGASFFGAKGAIDAWQSSAIQDAKRLAILHNNNPAAFKRIYSGISTYMSNKK